MAKKKKHFSRIERTAYHEAGHAVMCFLLRQRFKNVTIIPDEDSLGKVSTTFVKTYWKDVEWSASPIKVEKAIKISLAAIESEYIFTGRRRWQSAGDDIHNAVDLASRLGGSKKTIQKYIEYLFSLVNDMLNWKDHKRMVKELAKALLKEKTIGYHRAREIMREARDVDVNEALEKLRENIKTGKAAIYVNDVPPADYLKARLNYE